MTTSSTSRFTPGQKTMWWDRYFLLIIIGGAFLFMAISLAIGLHQSVWFDEAYSIMLAKQPADQLVHLTAIDTHPPLYYLLLKAWVTLFGWSELALRSLSVLAAGGAVVVAGLIVRRTFGIKAALVSLPFVVFAPFLLRYGFEIRMYALASLIGVVATYTLVRAVQAKEGYDQWMIYITYAVLVALGMYTLYYTALLWITHAIWLAWVTYKNKQSILKAPWLRAFIISIALFLPWLPAFVSQVGNGALASIAQPMTVENLLGIVSFGFVYQPTWQLGAVVSLLVLLAIAVSGIFIHKSYSIASKTERPYLLLFAMYLLIPVIVLTVVSLARPMYVERYLAHVEIGAMMYIGVIVALCLRKTNKKTWIAAGSLLVVMIVGVVHLADVGNYNFQRLQKPMLKQAAATIRDCERGTTVFAADPYVAIELAYYLPSCQIHFYSETLALRGGYAPLSDSSLHVDDPVKELASSRVIYYVYYDQQKSTMPMGLKQTSLKSFDALNIATFSVE